jgi:hypothetical protein
VSSYVLGKLVTMKKKNKRDRDREKDIGGEKLCCGMSHEFRDSGIRCGAGERNECVLRCHRE